MRVFGRCDPHAGAHPVDQHIGKRGQPHPLTTPKGPRRHVQVLSRIHDPLVCLVFLVHRPPRKGLPDPALLKGEDERRDLPQNLVGPGVPAAHQLRCESVRLISRTGDVDAGCIRDDPVRRLTPWDAVRRTVTEEGPPDHSDPAR